MHELDCPRCGRRPLDEFTFGGERRTRRRRLLTDPDDRDFDEVWIFDNPDGVATERWFHAAGCRRWLTVRRDTERRPRGRGPMTDGYAARRLDILARDRARFGAGVIAELPSIRRRARRDVRVRRHRRRRRPVRGRRSGRRPAPRRPACGSSVFDGVEPNPGTASIERGSAALRAGLPSAVRLRSSWRPGRRVGDGLREGDRAPRTQSACCHVTWLPR